MMPVRTSLLTLEASFSKNETDPHEAKCARNDFREKKWGKKSKDEKKKKRGHVHAT
jgi:hypothetical protein